MTVTVDGLEEVVLAPLRHVLPDLPARLVGVPEVDARPDTDVDRLVLTAEKVGHVRVIPVTGLVSVIEMSFVPKKSWYVDTTAAAMPLSPDG